MCQLMTYILVHACQGNHICHFHHATSTRETPSIEEEAVLCFCGFGEGISQSPEGSDEMGFEEAVCC